VHLAGAAAALSAVSRIARAQAYPARPVRTVVGSAKEHPAEIRKLKSTLSNAHASSVSYAHPIVLARVPRDRQPGDKEAEMLFNRSCIRAIVIFTALVMTVAAAAAFDETKYPDWSGQWQRPRGAAFPNVGNQWDQSKPPGLNQ
jgi:hypothetical protein